MFNHNHNHNQDHEDDDHDLLHHDNPDDQECLGLRLGEECRERNPGQLVCGCSNIGSF